VVEHSGGSEMYIFYIFVGVGGEQWMIFTVVLFMFELYHRRKCAVLSMYLI
jgi:hypothetical protein